MQMVISMDDKIYKHIMEMQFFIPDIGSGKGILYDILKSIRTGTPLPKGHGRLIDADELKKHKYHDNNKCENAVSIAQVDWQPTTIEADKAESEE